LRDSREDVPASHSVRPDTYSDFGSESSSVAAYRNLPAGWEFVVKTLDKDVTLIMPADKNYVTRAMAD
jgi:hypothetical protein